jgi:hypothetical protein
MEFNNVRKWMQKMNNILDLYEGDESFTQSEKNLLLDYNQKIRDSISTLKVEDSEEPTDSNAKEMISKKEETNFKADKAPANQEISNRVSENQVIPGSGSTKYHELFQFKKAEDLSEKLDSTPIDNIQKAMGLNERILTQNELFRGDKNSFDTTVKKLNSLNSFDEARNYLSDEIIPVYDWTHEDRVKKAQEFIKLVKRKYS